MIYKKLIKNIVLNGVIVDGGDIDTSNLAKLNEENTFTRLNTFNNSVKLDRIVYLGEKAGSSSAPSDVWLVSNKEAKSTIRLGWSANNDTRRFDLNMENRSFITHLPDPIDEQHATNKRYVDNIANNLNEKADLTNNEQTIKTKQVGFYDNNGDYKYIGVVDSGPIEGFFRVGDLVMEKSDNGFVLQPYDGEVIVKSDIDFTSKKYVDNLVKSVSGLKLYTLEKINSGFEVADNVAKTNALGDINISGYFQSLTYKNKFPDLPSELAGNGSGLLLNVYYSNDRCLQQWFPREHANYYFQRCKTNATTWTEWYTFKPNDNSGGSTLTTNYLTNETITLREPGGGWTTIGVKYFDINSNSISSEPVELYYGYSAKTEEPKNPNVSFYSTTYINNLENELRQAILESSGGEVDLSDYYNKSEIDTKLETKMNVINNSSDIGYNVGANTLYITPQWKDKINNNESEITKLKTSKQDKLKRTTIPYYGIDLDNNVFSFKKGITELVGDSEVGAAEIGTTYDKKYLDTKFASQESTIVSGENKVWVDSTNAYKKIGNNQQEVLASEKWVLEKISGSGGGSAIKKITGQKVCGNNTNTTLATIPSGATFISVLVYRKRNDGTWFERNPEDKSQVMIDNDRTVKIWGVDGGNFSTTYKYVISYV